MEHGPRSLLLGEAALWRLQTKQRVWPFQLMNHSWFSLRSWIKSAARGRGNTGEVVGLLEAALSHGDFLDWRGGYHFFYIAFRMLPKSYRMPEGWEPPSGSEIQALTCPQVTTPTWMSTRHEPPVCMGNLSNSPTSHLNLRLPQGP